MKNFLTAVLVLFNLANLVAQWQSIAHVESKTLNSKTDSSYNLDLQQMIEQLANAQLSGKGSTPLIIQLPTLDGRMEKFEVFSLPVVEKNMAKRYRLGSYSGTKVGDATTFVRFSVSPYGLHSMIFKNGQYEFIEAQDSKKMIYKVFPKTKKLYDERGFSCNTKESVESREQIESLRKQMNFSNLVIDHNTSSDQKYRTYRLAISVTGEYTQYFGGLDQAAAAINATMTRVNGIFEKDFAIHMDVQDLPQLIFTNPSTDPYSNASQGVGGAWNLQLQQTLSSKIRNDSYDIGHLFARSGGIGLAGGIGTVCRNPNNDTDTNSKGSAFSSPRNSGPEGDFFDIDLVAHEMGHQFGADHTFTTEIQSAPKNTAQMEPASGSTIMSYAGITSINVQSHNDAYFHLRNVEQVKSFIISQNCGTTTDINNEPPVLSDLSERTIPKGTAFILIASATDHENDPLTYSWEEYDLATVPQTTVINDNLTGPKFRSLPASVTSYRYFPKLDLVLDGKLSSAEHWESVSNIPRIMKFKVLVRDNHPDVTQQQTSIGQQTINVGNEGPFKVTTRKVYNNSLSPITWDVVNTHLAPYNVSTVKIDYTLDNGLSWIILTDVTPNDGSETFDFSAIPFNSDIIVRVSAIDNVFYAVSKVNVSKILICNESAPIGLSAETITQTSAKINWDVVENAKYILRYKRSNENTWTELNAIPSNHVDLLSLLTNTSYDVYVAAVCSGVTGSFAHLSFITGAYTYCAAGSTSPSGERIANVTFAGINNSSSVNSGYEDFSNVTGNIIAGQTYSFSASSPSTSSSFDQVIVWIDLNQDGDFEDIDEKVLTTDVKTSSWTGYITIPFTALSGRTKMRVRLHAVNSSPNETSCGTSYFGQVEDYSLFVGNLAVSDTKIQKIEYYPNPVTDILNLQSDTKIVRIELFSQTGQQIKTIMPQNTKSSINLIKLTSGIYYIKVYTANSSDIYKIIKK